MNLVYIHSHDTGRFIQPYGYPVPTPRLAQFAGEATLFRQAHSACPTCSPSRSSLLTGQYPHENGMFGLAHLGWKLKDYSRHLSRILQTGGFRTGLYGIQHEGGTGDLGYDIVSPFLPDEGLSAWTQEQASGGDQPFFLSFGFVETHLPFPELEEGETADYTLPPAGFPDTPRTREDFARFTKMAGDLDRKIGVVLDALDQAGRRDDTLVLITTDHGIAFPRMKCTLYDGGTGVMLMMRGPGIEPGVIQDALVSQVDLMPTLCERLGVSLPDPLSGVSLNPLLDKQVESVREEVFTEMNWHGAYEPMRAIRTDRYKLILNLGGRRLRPRSNCDESLSKDELREAGWQQEEIPKEEFYDLMLDPMEKVNLVGDSRYAKAEADLRQRLQAWRERSHDPLLESDWIPPPPGAVTYDADDPVIDIAQRWHKHLE